MNGISMTAHYTQPGPANHILHRLRVDGLRILGKGRPYSWPEAHDWHVSPDDAQTLRDGGLDICRGCFGWSVANVEADRTRLVRRAG